MKAKRRRPDTSEHRWGPLSLGQRKLLASKFADFGNVAAGSLLFGALIREETFTELSIFLGLLLLVSAYVVAIALSRYSS